VKDGTDETTGKPNEPEGKSERGWRQQKGKGTRHAKELKAKIGKPLTIKELAK